MKISILFLAAASLMMSCSPKTDEKELRFYNRLLNDKIEEVNRSLILMDRQINRYEYKRDTIILIEAQNLVSKINTLLDSNKIRTACKEVYKELKNVDYNVIKEKYEAINELFYLDSLYGVHTDTLTKLKYRNSIYNGLNFVLCNKSFNLHYSCSFASPTQVMYNLQEYKLNDTLEMMVVPGSFIYMNEYMESTKNFKGLNVTIDFQKYFFLNNKTKDTIDVMMKPMKNILLLSAVIKEKGDYTLKGKFTISNGKRSSTSITNKLIYIE